MATLLELGAGEYLGEVEGRRRSGRVVLSEVRHRSGHDLPRHRHEAPYFSILLAGHYAEQMGSREVCYAPYSVGFHPAHFEHEDHVGRDGGLFLLIDLEAAWLDGVARALPGPASLDPRLLDGPASVLGLSLYRELREGLLDPLTTECFVWELLGCLGNGERLSERQPRWVARAAQMLNEEFVRPLTLAEVASSISVHPAHLSREFRRRFGHTLGEYVHRLRVQAACALIGSGRPLADVALETGFSDQSHFTRVFKRLIGCTPRHFRILVG